MNLKNIILNKLRKGFTKLIPPHATFDQNRNDRAGALYKAWGHIISNNIKGSYYEFGVYRGDSLYESLRIYNDYREWISGQKHSSEEWRRKINYYSEHKFYAFDTFEGMPENDEGHHAFQKGTFMGEIDLVKSKIETINKYGTIEYVKGEYGNVKKTEKDRIKEFDKVAIANIDCDLCISTIDALEIIKGKLQQGCILMMDDWYQFEADNKKGQRKATKEFLIKNKNISLEDYIIYGHIGKAFIVHLNK
ncbi:MAG: hypothetical protein GW938_00455 [Leptospira sp.]|nr:hypothetical protein [Leptospira sp.]